MSMCHLTVLPVITWKGTGIWDRGGRLDWTVKGEERKREVNTAPWSAHAVKPALREAEAGEFQV